MDNYIAKPIKPKELFNIICRWMLKQNIKKFGGQTN